jgi:iron complex outermembrane recepter protein
MSRTKMAGGRKRWIAFALLSSSIVYGSHQAIAEEQVASAESARRPIETVVVTGSRFNPDVAPAKASLNTTEPQTIINRSYIEDSVATTSDYTTILAIVPSLTGIDVNGPGLSDGNVKNTLRGQPDGNFVISYDGIPFGDTNGPTHHSESYFPGSTIGSIDVDRGPGNAGTLGAATFGGSINMFSEPLTDDTNVRVKGTYGSWGTWNANANLQTGTFDALGLDTRVLVNLQETASNGYLTLQSTHHNNELLKIETDVAPGWTLTLFGNANGLYQKVNDSNGATPAQVTAFGKQFALQNTDPKLPTFVAFNPEWKQTDMDYLSLRGAISPDLRIDEQFYTYAYINKTVSATTVAQTAAEILAGTAEGLGTKVGGVKFPTDIPGYTKLNAYRVWGNIFRTALDYSIGDFTGEARFGFWWEGAATQRQRFYMDLTKCLNQAGGPCKPFDVELSGIYGDANQKKGTVFNGITGVGFIEHTGWDQYQPFVEIDLHPIDGLTITPGVKYVYWKHTVNAPVSANGSPPGPYVGPPSFVTSRFLTFAEANYKIQQNWSAYFQYADGIYVPDITAFQQKAIFTFPTPQTTMNLQLGTVYYADNFTFDGDFYYVASDNTINFVPCTQLTPPGPAGETCATNIGTAIFKGVEGEATYVFGDDEFDGMLDGLAVFANGSINSAKSSGFQLAQAPFWTAAGGLIYKDNGFKLSLIDKIVGQQYSDTFDKRFDVNGSTPVKLAPGQTKYLGSFYRLPAYNNLDFTGSYDLGDLVPGADIEIGGGIYNVLNSRDIVALKVNDKTPLGGTSAQDFTNRPNSLDQYYFMPERSYQFTIKAHL